ncbi:M48 metallopeptidase family protein [Helicobacter burdigaliensis]|uniref:M48 metallopeptidase family protein n=1 Tax=Helicobacter burdigaliensis TaxID=2315334 RepID=UPI0022B80614|nr:M48 family metallopeptidase [Helicobacter burdigaliensis]
MNNIQIRKMKTKWGSCNPNTKNINLHIELIKKPKICIKYVIFHELAHLIYPNHSKEFYCYLTCYMSDWQKRKELLEKPNI